MLVSKSRALGIIHCKSLGCVPSLAPQCRIGVLRPSHNFLSSRSSLEASRLGASCRVFSPAFLSSTSSPLHCIPTSHIDISKDKPSSSSNPSSSSKMPPPDADPTREKVLDCALRHVQSHGWTSQALVAGVQELGYSSSLGASISEGELVHHFIKKCNRMLADKCAVPPGLSGTTKEKLRQALRWRLEMHIPYLAHWQQAMAIGGFPQNLPTTMNLIANMVDDIWHHAGDISTDTSWYTKRALLTGVYVSTEVVMTLDKSFQFEDTWSFLDRRLEDVHTLQSGSGSLNDLLDTVNQVSRQLFSQVSQAAGQTPLGDVGKVGGPVGDVAQKVGQAVSQAASSLGKPPEELERAASKLGEAVQQAASSLKAQGGPVGEAANKVGEAVSQAASSFGVQLPKPPGSAGAVPTPTPAQPAAQSPPIDSSATPSPTGAATKPQV
eukprot:g39002.t1